MATITLSVPDRLKSLMAETDWINWSSVARHAFAQTLGDVNELERMRKAARVSEIAATDDRQASGALVEKTVAAAEKAARRLKSGGTKALTPGEFGKWCDAL